MLADATVVADLEAGRIQETDACAGAETGTQIGTQRQQGTGYPLDKAPIAHQTWKGILPLGLPLFKVVGFEITVGGLMEANQNCHDFAQAQTARSLPVSKSIAKQLVVPYRFKLLAEIIDGAEEVF